MNAFIVVLGYISAVILACLFMAGVVDVIGLVVK